MSRHDVTSHTHPISYVVSTPCSIMWPLPVRRTIVQAHPRDYMTNLVWSVNDERTDLALLFEGLVCVRQRLFERPSSKAEEGIMAERLASRYTVRSKNVGRC